MHVWKLLLIEQKNFCNEIFNLNIFERIGENFIYKYMYVLHFSFFPEPKTVTEKSLFSNQHFDKVWKICWLEIEKCVSQRVLGVQAWVPGYQNEANTFLQQWDGELVTIY